MPIRTDTRREMQQVQQAGYSAAQGVGVAFHDVAGSGPTFWDGLLAGVQKSLPGVEQQVRARGYLQGQQDSAAGKERQQVHASMREDYEEGYNRAQVGASLSKYQLEMQKSATEFANAGRSNEEWQAHVQERTNELLGQAGAQGMNLNERDWQAWLTGVESTRDTAGDLYQKLNTDRASYMRSKAYALEGSAAVSTFAAADEAGNPMQALGNIGAYITRVTNDTSMSPAERDGNIASVLMQTAGAAKSSDAVGALSAYYQNLPEFKALPTDTQTRITQSLQAQYNNRAADEVGQVYEYMHGMQGITDPGDLAKQYPLDVVASKLNQEQQLRRISPAQMYSMLDGEAARRRKLDESISMQSALQEGVTMTDIATRSGMTPGKVRTALTQQYAQANGGYSAGGLALLQRGLQSGASDIADVGIGMLQQDAQSLANIDPRNLKHDADGHAIYPSTVVSSLANLKAAYDGAVQAGNQAQANQLVAGLPDAVAYGIQQNADENNLASVVYRRSGDIAAGRVVTAPASMPKEILATMEDVNAGMFDLGITQAGRNRNILGVQSYVFTSDADEKHMQSRMAQVNGALSEEYTSLYQQGKLPALSGPELKNWLVGRVANRAVRVDDSSDTGALLILPNVGDKASQFGTVDNRIIGDAMSAQVKDFRARNPGAASVQLRYDNIADEMVFIGVDENNVALTTADGVPMSEIRNSVKSVENTLTNSGQGGTGVSLAVPNAGFVQFNTANAHGIDRRTYTDAVSKLVSYEGYTDAKGFSILGTHPTTGAKLNEDKYVKQPGDSAQVAADKLGAYLGDKVLPQVAKRMPQFKGLPQYLQDGVFKQLVETTYHAGNADAYSGFLSRAMRGEGEMAVQDFKESALYKDAGASSRRNKDRLRLLEQVSSYTINMK